MIGVRARAAFGATAAAPATAQSPARPSPRLGAGGRLRRWWLARLPRTDSSTLGQRNIYILPTRAGLTFAVTLVVMLVASINYQLSLGYALTFLLAGAALASMHATHANLRGLTLHLRPPAPAHAGDAVAIDVVVANPGRDRHALALRFDDRAEHGAADAWCDAPAGADAGARLTFAPPHRGRHALPALVVETVFPFGLFRAWSVWRPASTVLVWPRPEHPAPPLPAPPPAASDTVERPALHGAGSELDGVRPWRRGDTMRQVAWKKVAKGGELVSRQTTAGAAQRALRFSWTDTPGRDVEHRLARLAAWVLAADHAGVAWALSLPPRELPPSVGAAQRRAALDLLAEHR